MTACIYVVGDPAQTIYSFAGASSYNLLNFASNSAPSPPTSDSTTTTVPPADRQLRQPRARSLTATRRLSQTQLQARPRPPGVKPSTTAISKRGWHRIRRLVDGSISGDCAILPSQRSRKSSAGHWANNTCATRVKRDSGWQNSALADDAQTRLAMLEKALGAGGDVMGVTISTIHASKGLEFKHVLIGCSEGLIPGTVHRPKATFWKERRLMYVAVACRRHTRRVLCACPRRRWVRSRAQEITLLPVTAGRGAFISLASSVPSASFMLIGVIALVLFLVEQRTVPASQSMLSGISCCAVVCSVPVVADAARSLRWVILGLFVRQLRQQIRMRPFASRASGPSCADAFPTAQPPHACAWGGAITCPSGFQNVRSAGPPMARSRRKHLEAVRYAEYAPCPHATTASPALHQESRFSNAFMACFCSGCPGTPPW